MATFYVIPKDEDLLHYGILGMKWGVRRYQNSDGSLTSAGRRRYLEGIDTEKIIKKGLRNPFHPLIGAGSELLRQKVNKRDNMDRLEGLSSRGVNLLVKDIKEDRSKGRMKNLVDQIDKNTAALDRVRNSKEYKSLVKQAEDLKDKYLDKLYSISGDDPNWEKTWVDTENELNDKLKNIEKQARKVEERELGKVWESKFKKSIEDTLLKELNPNYDPDVANLIKEATKLINSYEEDVEKRIDTYWEL